MRATTHILAAIATTTLSDPVTSPPIHPALRPDVQELIAAANLTAPYEINAADVKNCGKYIIKGGWDFDLNANPQCADIEKTEIMHRVYNDKCGLCVTFQWGQCVGDVTWSGKTVSLVDIPDSRSWYCIA